MDAFFIALLVWCSYTDIRNRTVPNLAVILLMCLGFAHTVFMALPKSSWWTYPAGMVLAVPFFVAWLKGGLGAGDVKLILGIGLYLGVLNMLIAFALIIPMLAILLIRSWFKAKTLKRTIPLAPVLAFGAIGTVALVYLYALLQV